MTKLSPIAASALEKVLALRRLTHENQTVTRRSQNVVLQALNAEDTIQVAEALENHRQKFGW